METVSRETKPLDGVWRFTVDADRAGRRERWWASDLPGTLDMPVPSSYNDVIPDASIRDHVGDVWYQTSVRPPTSWQGKRVVLRFDAAAHLATVWVGDEEVVTHRGGFVPFEVDVTDHLRYGAPNRLTVAVNNELSLSTMPPGKQYRTPAGATAQALTADYFNYTGLNRRVWLYATPHDHIRDVTVRTQLDGSTGLVGYDVVTSGPGAVEVRLLDAHGTRVAAASGHAGELVVPRVRPWEPGEGYLYRLEIGYGEDVYELPVGVRTVAVRGREFLINGRPFTFRGFGRHQESPVRGHGHDDVVMVHDFALLDWIGANSIRTAHYPYAEEVLDYADRHGILVIGEQEAGMINLAMDFGPRTGPEPQTFGPDGFGADAQEGCVTAVRELIQRDKNHPSVVMWCLSNEPDSAAEGAREFLQPIVTQARELDPTRPVCFTNVFLAPAERDRITDLFDVICLNRYYGWYLDGGDLASAEQRLTAELDQWAARHDSPILITECGAEALPGVHEVAATMWTEEYQSEVLEMVARVADAHEAVVGQHVWSFADFRTRQEIIRPEGNRKGVFDRNRRPKAAAHTLRRLWRR
ncbi:beta-glucuronidase [Nonomuraea basaltis]|uniref:beta-glucuronidase n=1 Tax=Nonomuraea basaltis TaxID=2495887 RepID=UPI00197DA7F8|nr:beta-glucuronidase [Nonomuraea basaltis]